MEPFLGRLEDGVWWTDGVEAWGKNLGVPLSIKSISEVDPA